MKPLRFEAVELLDMVKAKTISHTFLTQGVSSAVGGSKKRLVRLTGEMSSLQSSLPVEYGSSIFVRCDEARLDYLKALIIGPEGTPYGKNFGCK